MKYKKQKHMASRHKQPNDPPVTNTGEFKKAKTVTNVEMDITEYKTDNAAGTNTVASVMETNDRAVSLQKNEVVVNMRREAFDKMMLSICRRPAESGGLLLGPVGTNDITDFYFDSGGTITGSSYSPDHKTLTKKLKEEWMPDGLDFKGFSHSHPGKLDILTIGDIIYIKRLLLANPDMPIFIAPIIIPHEFRMRMWVVLRANPDTAVEARINFF